MNYDWDFLSILNTDNCLFLARGFGLSLLLTAVTIAFGTAVGVLGGLLASAGNVPGLMCDRYGLAAIRPAAVFVVDLIRSIPLLILILLSYYGLPGMTANLLPPPSSIQCAIVAMVINYAAFLADLLRGAIIATPIGMIHAGKALGMSDRTVLTRIVLPNGIREILPGYVLLNITIFKMSTLCSVVAVYEVLHSAQTIIQRTYRPLELYSLVALLFAATILPLSYLARRLEQHAYFRRRS